MSSRDPELFIRRRLQQRSLQELVDIGYGCPTHPYFTHEAPPITFLSMPGLNPSAAHFQPPQHNGKMGYENGAQVSSDSDYTHLADRVQRLEFETDAIRRYVENLNGEHSSLVDRVEEIKKGGWKVDIGPFQTNSMGPSKKAIKTETVYTPGTSMADAKETNGGEKKATSNGTLPPHLRKSSTTTNGSGNGTLPPHLRASAQRANGSGGISPHLRGQGVNDALVTDGKIDTEPVMFPPTPARTPPASETGQTGLTGVSTSTFHPNHPRQTIEDPYTTNSGQGWSPHALFAMPSLSSGVLSTIPPTKDMVTFNHDFLANQLGGSFWSPGLKYIPPGSGMCMLPTRSYYLLDFTLEPYLPRAPGEHGAKLTAFFNQNPEEVYGEDAGGEFEDVPMFVCASPYAQDMSKRRYVYFGNYSQTRWSDKLDYDRMVEQVPAQIKQYWAEELSSQGRAEWVSEALMKHFFPKPEYEGRLFGAGMQGSDSITPEEEAKLDEKVEKDVKAYVKELRAWEKDAALKTKLIKAEFILKAFEAADADDPPALRLWWEYLQCTNWDRGFYDMLVQLQSRNSNYLK